MRMFMKNLRTVYTFLVVCGIIGGLACQSAPRSIPAGDWEQHGFSAEKRDALLSFFENAVEKGSIPGCALLVIHDDEAILREAFGVYDMDTGQPFTVDQVCAIASVSKCVTSTLMMMLDECGAFSLDDPVEKWIPAFKDIRIREAQRPENPPRVHHLLSHRSGLPGNADLGDNTRLVRGSLAEIVEALAEYGLMAEPGTRYAYSEQGYITAGRVAEVATGKPFDVLMKEILLDPLGMTYTTLHPEIEDIEQWPRVYDRTEDGWAPMPAEFLRSFLESNIDPGGRLFSTLDDLGRLLLFHLNRGEVDGKRLVSPESLARMVKNSEELPEPAYGFGLALESGGPGQARHFGGGGTFVWLDFEQDLAGVYISQVRWAGIMPYQRRLIETILSTFSE